MDLSLDPEKKEERQKIINETIRTYEENFGSLDMVKSYLKVFELLWYGQMPCFDVKGITSQKKDELSFLKRCYWKNKRISCSAILQKRPTDRGMCCSFNMERAETLLKASKYSKAVSILQEEEERNGFEKDELPAWYQDLGEPKPEAGRKKGLTLIVDRHSDALSPSSVTEDFQGFLTIVDDKQKFPLTSTTNLIVRPGYETNIEVSAVKIHSFDEIRQYRPEKRNCYFPDEFALESHRLYSQPSCILECKVKFAYERMRGCMDYREDCNCNTTTTSLNMTEESCIPWFFPIPDHKKNVKMCNPWQTCTFQKILEEHFRMQECTHCLPDCNTTVYDTSISYAKLQECDHTNTGANRLCDMINSNLNPAPWTYLAQIEYQKAAPNDSLPWYLETDPKKNVDSKGRVFRFTDRRNKSSNQMALKNALFKSEIIMHPTYNAFEKDIGTVNVFFGNAHSTKYIKKNRMSGFGFLSQVGGSVGLAMGISMLSIVELIYWLTIRLFKDMKNNKAISKK